MADCAIIAGGDFFEFSLPQNCFVIAADSGLKNALKNNISPNLIVGDFDSYKGELPKDTEIITLPTEKNETDLYYCVKEAIRRKFRFIDIYCSQGNRPDHTLAAYSALLYIKENGAHGKIITENAEIRLIYNESTFIKKSQKYKYLSFLPIFGGAQGLSITGVKYPLKNASVSCDNPYTVSNEITAPSATVEVKNGYLLLIQTS